MTVTEWAMPTVDNIRAEMARKRKKQGDMAAVLGIAQSGVSQRMNGKTPFNVNELYAIAHWLGVSPRIFLVDETPGGAPTSQYLAESVGPATIPFARSGELQAA